MPDKHDNKALNDPFLDGRVRMLPCQVERAKRLRDEGKSYREIGEIMGVTPSAVRYKIDDAAKERNVQARKDRGGSKIYYDRKQTVEAIRELRKKKRNLFG
jgi:predicted transcriptional regulator